MENLTIEEKAKRYDEAIEKLRNAFYNNNSRMCEEYRNAVIRVIEPIFPELKESEDWIPKEIIKYLKEKGDFRSCWIAWLEKQGEQKSVWHNEDEEPQRDSLILLVMQSGTPIVAKIIEPNHIFNHGERWAYIDDLLEKQGEDKVEPKFKVGDIMRTLEEAADGFTDGMPVVVSIDDEDYHCTNERIAIKDQDEYEYPPMNRKQESAEWSEEDERLFQIIIDILDKEEHKGHLSHTDLIACVKKLKSLRPQNTWKLSKEQLIALRQVISGCSYDIEPLVEIEEQLKKLREE